MEAKIGYVIVRNSKKRNEKIQICGFKDEDRFKLINGKWHEVHSLCIDNKTIHEFVEEEKEVINLRFTEETHMDLC